KTRNTRKEIHVGAKRRGVETQQEVTEETEDRVHLRSPLPPVQNAHARSINHQNGVSPGYCNMCLDCLARLSPPRIGPWRASCAFNVRLRLKKAPCSTIAGTDPFIVHNDQISIA